MSEAKTYIAGLIQNARAAQKEFEERFTTQRAVDEVVRAIALTIYNAKEELAPEVVEETGMGTVAYKITKMIATTTAPGLAFATRSAPATAPPELTPQKIPSRTASSRMVFSASR